MSNDRNKKKKLKNTVLNFLGFLLKEKKKKNLLKEKHNQKNY